MKKKTQINLDTLRLICRLNPLSLKTQLKDILSKDLHYKKIHEDDEYLYAEGDLPVLLVAHLDTVFKQPPRHIFYDSDKNVMWSPQGLGADDRAGVYAVLQILIDSGLRPSVLFTLGEETGGTGAYAFCADFPFPAQDLKFIIELDRQGSDEAVFYLCKNQEFIDFIESFSFQTDIGTFTDISIICPQWKIAGVNLSVGYINEHSYIEHLYLDDLNATIKKVINILEIANNAPVFKYVYPKDYFSFDKECEICHQRGNHYSLYSVIKSKDKKGWVCGNCYSAYTSYCDICGNDFIDKTLSKNICPRCKGRK